MRVKSLLNIFIIAVCSLSAAIVFAGRDLSGGGTVVFLPKCKRPILLDVFLYRAKYEPQNICDDDTPAGLESKQIISSTFQKLEFAPEASQTTGAFYELDLAVGAGNYQIDMDVLPLRYRAKITPRQFQVYAKNYLLKILNHPLSSSNFGISLLEMVNREVLFTKQNFKLDEVSFFDSKEIRKQFPAIRFEHVAVTKKLSLSPSKGQSGNVSWSIPERAFTDMVINMQLWDQLSLNSQFALLLHEGMRKIQFYLSRKPEALVPLEELKVYELMVADWPKMDASRWDELVTKVVGSLVSSGAMPRDMHQIDPSNYVLKIADYLSTFSLNNWVNSSARKRPEFQVEAKSVYDAAQTVLLHLMRGEKISSQHAELIQNAKSPVYIGGLRLGAIMSILGAPYVDILKLSLMPDFAYTIANRDQNINQLIDILDSSYEFSMEEYEAMFLYYNGAEFLKFFATYNINEVEEFWEALANAGCNDSTARVLAVSTRTNDDAYLVELGAFAASCSLESNKHLSSKYGNRWRDLVIEEGSPLELAMETGNQAVIQHYFDQMFKGWRRVRDEAILLRVALVAIRTANIEVFQQLEGSGLDINKIEQGTVVNLSPLVASNKDKINTMIEFLRQRNVNVKLRLQYGDATF